MFSDPLSLILLFGAFLISLSFHEAAHAFAAHYLGDPTAKNLGRLTLNPVAHLDLVGTLSIFFLHFGWGKPVPVDPRHFENPRRDMALVSFAGPAANFTIAFLSTGILFFFGKVFGNLSSSLLFDFFQTLIWINLFLGFFNLFPLPPLDGGSVLLGILPKKIVPTASEFLNTHGIILFFTLLAVNLVLQIPIITGPVSFFSEKLYLLFAFFWTGIF